MVIVCQVANILMEQVYYRMKDNFQQMGGWRAPPPLSSQHLSEAAAEADEYRSTIERLIAEIRQKYNCPELRELRYNIDRLEEYNLHKLALLNAQIRQNYSLCLEIGQMEKAVLELNQFFVQVMRRTPDRRVEDLYQMFNDIQEKVLRLGIPVVEAAIKPGSIHRRGSVPKQPKPAQLITKAKEQKQKRLKLQKEKDMIIEGTQEMLSQRDKTMKKLQEQNQRLHARIQEHSKDLQQRDDNIAECMKTIEKLRKSLCEMQLEQLPSPPVQAPTIIKVQTQNLSEKIEASVNSAIEKALKQQSPPAIRVSPPSKNSYRDRSSESANPQNILSPHQTQKQFYTPLQERTNSDMMRMLLLQASTIEEFLVCNQID